MSPDAAAHRKAGCILTVEDPEATGRFFCRGRCRPIAYGKPEPLTCNYGWPLYEDKHRGGTHHHERKTGS